MSPLPRKRIRKGWNPWDIEKKANWVMNPERRRTGIRSSLWLLHESSDSEMFESYSRSWRFWMVYAIYSILYVPASFLWMESLSVSELWYQENTTDRGNLRYEMDLTKIWCFSKSEITCHDCRHTEFNPTFIFHPNISWIQRDKFLPKIAGISGLR